MMEIAAFNYEGKQLRTIEIDSEPFFVGKDVANILGYKNTKDALSKHVLSEDKRGSQIATPGGNQNMVVINEYGFNDLVLSSQLDRAKEVKKWLTHEVMPSIRRTGSYNVPETPEDRLKLTMEVASRTVERVDNIEKQVNDLKNNVVIDSSSYAAVGRLVSQNVYRFLDDRHYPHVKHNVSSLFKDINHGIKQITGVRTRSQIKSKDFEKVMQYIDAWEPATATRMELVNKKVGA